MAEVSPSVEALAGLVLDMIDGTWPTTEGDRRDFYDRVGLRPVPAGAGDYGDDPRLDIHGFETSLPGVGGVDTVYRDQLLSVMLSAYAQPGADGAESRAAFPELKRLISTRLGEPVEELGTARGPVCYWAIAPLQIEMYCFQRLSSSVIVAPSHIGRTAAHEREAAKSRRASRRKPLEERP